MEEATIEGARPACWLNSADFADYRSEEEPEVYAAQRLCVDTCEVFKICKRKAQLERPVHGVWAGDVWGDDREGKGRIIRRAPKPSEMTA